MGIAQMILLKFTCAVSFWTLGAIFVMSKTIKRALLCLFIFILVSASVVVAAVVGSMEGHTTDTGFLQGGLLGVLAGVITAVQVVGPVLQSDQPFSKVALLRRVMDGKAIMGLVRPAVLKAYQWQIMAVDASYMEISDMFAIIQETKGLSKECIKKIPTFCYDSVKSKWSCPICLQDWKEGDLGRRLERCGHTFHIICIDKWLLRQETCPICRDHLTYYTCT